MRRICILLAHYEPFRMCPQNQGKTTGVFIEKAAFLGIGKFLDVGVWNKQSELFSSTITALLLGCVFSYFANNDKFHGFIRKTGITIETSYPSEWFGTFLKNVTYVVLHFKDERRLYEWPTEWPSEPERGHFVLEQAGWLEGGEEKPITGVESIMVNVKDVKWVEFMEKTWEEANG